jgi:hypothetical protein
LWDYCVGYSPPGTIPSTWILRRVTLVRPDVSEEYIASVRTEEGIIKLGTNLAVTGN